MTNWDLFQGSKANSIFKRINQCSPPCKQAKEEKSYDSIKVSTDAEENASDKIQHPFMIKNQQLSSRRECT